MFRALHPGSLRLQIDANESFHVCSFFKLRNARAPKWFAAMKPWQL